jgi:hypothetical protein
MLLCRLIAVAVVRSVGNFVARINTVPIAFAVSAIIMLGMHVPLMVSILPAVSTPLAGT